VCALFPACSIINDILDYSKIEADQLQLHPALHNVADVAETAALLCYDMADSKGLALSWIIAPDIPTQLAIDSTRRKCTPHTQRRGREYARLCMQMRSCSTDTCLSDLSVVVCGAQCNKYC